MTLDCASLSESARSYANSHGYCKRDKLRGAVPNDTVVGNCGSSWLYIRDTGIREATFSYGFASSQGVVIHRELNGYWSSTSGLSGYLNDTALMASSSYSTTRSRGTGYGAVNAWISGRVTLYWGGKCILGYPGDYEFIS